MAKKDDALAKYHALIDGLVARRAGVLPSRIRDKGWPKLPEHRALNALLKRLSPEDKELIAGIAVDARDGGMHDTLAYLQEQIDLHGLRFTVDGKELPVSPHDTELHWDFSARRDGKEWPSG